MSVVPIATTVRGARPIGRGGGRVSSINMTWGGGLSQTSTQAREDPSLLSPLPAFQEFDGRKSVSWMLKKKRLGPGQPCPNGILLDALSSLTDH